MTTEFPICISGLTGQRLMGHGACGRVYEAVRDGGQVCAVKVLDVDAVNHAYVGYCYEKLRGLPGLPHVVPVVDFHDGGADGETWYVMPWYGVRVPGSVRVEGATVEAECGRVEAGTAWRWIAEMAEGLAGLHLHAVVHCNFKTSNVFLDRGPTGDGPRRAVITDYGQGWMGGVEALPLADHALYAPPEQLRNPTQIQFGTGERWDVYAFGVTAFRLLTGVFPRGRGWAERWRDIELPDPVEFAALIEKEAGVSWPGAPVDGAEAARRAVVDKCLRLVPGERWVDVREVRDALVAIDQRVEADEKQAAWQAERDRWKASAEAAASASTASAVDRRPVVRPTGEPGRGLKWTAGISTAAAAVLGVLSILHYTGLRGARAVAAQQANDLIRLSSESTEGMAQRDRSLAEVRRALEEALAGNRRIEANLDASQAAADQFFESFLQAAAQLPAEGERTRLLLAGYEHFSSVITAHGKNPELAESLLRARCHLADIKLALGAPQEAADRFEEARAQIVFFLAANPSHPQAGALRLRAADCLLTAARLRLDGGHSDPAVLGGLAASLAEVSAAAEQAGHPPDLMRRVADGELVLAQAELARVSGDLPAATGRVDRAAELANQVLNDPRHAQPGDKVRVARALLLRGRLERRKSLAEAALATQVETAQLLLECGDQPEALDLLAQCYGETGAILQANGEARDAARAQGEAVKILSELVKLAPERTDYRMILAARYGDLAQLLRENGQAARALDYQKGAVDMVEALLEKDPGSMALATTLARLRADLSDLLVALNQKPEAMTQAQQALQLLDRLNLPGPPISTVDLSHRIAVARSYGVVGEVAEGAKQLAAAQACFEKAVAHYETAAAANPGDGLIDRGLTEVRMHLARVRQ